MGVALVLKSLALALCMASSSAQQWKQLTAAAPWAGRSDPLGNTVSVVGGIFCTSLLMRSEFGTVGHCPRCLEARLISQVEVQSNLSIYYSTHNYIFICDE